ncbi:MAG: prepilin-type N-terminal cleavage/methylation domain-containing protein [Patescibacteria group bacterium]
MRVSLKSRRGETLVEVLVSLMLLVVGSLGAVRLFGMAAINNELTKERVIATNLAREGLEAVRSVRDTNWLRFAGERRKCWNNIEAAQCLDDNGDSVPNQPITHKQQYRAEFEANFRWKLVPVGTDEVFVDRLNLQNGINGKDADYRLKLDANNLYSHTGATDTFYFREIYTEYLNDTATAESIASPQESSNVLRVTSRVEWYDRGKFSDVTLSTIITDHLSRENHN